MGELEALANNVKRQRKPNVRLGEIGEWSGAGQPSNKQRRKNKKPRIGKSVAAIDHCSLGVKEEEEEEISHESMGLAPHEVDLARSLSSLTHLQTVVAQHHEQLEEEHTDVNKSSHVISRNRLRKRCSSSDDDGADDDKDIAELMMRTEDCDSKGSKGCGDALNSSPSKDDHLHVEELVNTVIGRDKDDDDDRHLRRSNAGADASEADETTATAAAAAAAAGAGAANAFKDEFKEEDEFKDATEAMVAMRQCCCSSIERIGVHGWLSSLKLAKYVNLFEAHEVDVQVLPLLTMEDLDEMGVVAVGARRKMFTAIQQLRRYR